MLEVMIMPAAQRDMLELCHYLSGFYPGTAIRQYDRIMEKILKLPDFPEKYEVYRKGNYHFEYRKMVVDRYLVFYVVTDTVIEIRRILPGNQDVENML